MGDSVHTDDDGIDNPFDDDIFEVKQGDVLMGEPCALSEPFSRYIVKMGGRYNPVHVSDVILNKDGEHVRVSLTFSTRGSNDARNGEFTAPIKMKANFLADIKTVQRELAKWF